MADFPGNIASDGSLFLLKNNVSTILTSTITAAQTAITLSSSSPFPPVGYITVDTEAILYSANATATGVITVTTRGADSTTAAQHDAGASVYHNYVANHHNAMKDELIAVESNLNTRFGSGTSINMAQSSIGSFIVEIKNLNSVTSAAHAVQKITSGGGSGGDAYTHYLIDTQTNWVAGVDNSDSDKYKICPGTTVLGSNDTFVLDQAGYVSQPLQPSFLVYNSAADANVTGSGTQTTVDFDTEVFDQNADFSADTFTAPVTGNYQLNTNVYLEGLDTTHHSSVRLRIITSNRVHVEQMGDIPSGVTNKTISLSVLADMDSGDTAYVELLVAGATSTVDVYGSADGFTCFSGSLIN